MINISLPPSDFIKIFYPHTGLIKSEESLGPSKKSLDSLYTLAMNDLSKEQVDATIQLFVPEPWDIMSENDDDAEKGTVIEMCPIL